MLLTMNKYSMKDAKDIQNTCFKLNSLQLHTLLAGYLYATNEPHIPPVSTSSIERHSDEQPVEMKDREYVLYR